MRVYLGEMDNQKPLTPVATDNKTSNEFVNKNIQQQKSREIDMRIYWVHNRVRQGHFLVYW